MAGMEQVEVHSKSYVVRWMKAVEGNTISWSLEPHKKSIHVGIFKHPGNANGSMSTLPAMRASTLEPTKSPGLNLDSSNVNPSNKPIIPRRPSASGSREDSASVIEKLAKLGINVVEWVGKCDPDRVSMGHYDVPTGGSGMYGLVFDNTHSKQFSKTITFTFLTYPTNAPPQSGHHMRHALQRKPSGSKTNSPLLLPISDSNEHLPQASASRIVPAEALQKIPSREVAALSAPSCFTGALSKKRRKQNQGWARRFFSLDFTTSTLSYYKNRSSSALRGAIPLSLAAIGVNAESRQISLDSGVELWILRAYNDKEFQEWKLMLDKASQSSIAPSIDGPSSMSQGYNARYGDEVDQEWRQVESLVGRVGGITDAVRRLAKDTDPRYSPVYSTGVGGVGVKEATASTSATTGPLDADDGDYFQTDDSSAHRRGFWKRSSSTGGHSPSGILRRNTAGQKPSQAALALPSPPASSLGMHRRATVANPQFSDEHVHERCMAVLRDLDTVVAQFSTLIAESRQRRLPQLALATSRNSIDSTRSADFFDAEDGLSPQMLEIEKDSEPGTSPERSAASEIDDSESTSDNEPETPYNHSAHAGQSSSYPKKPKSLLPLPREAIQRRTTVPPSSGPPPSLISFLRKNAGKDLSTIAMPVESNEPLSLLQRQAEELEYSEMLDAATTAAAETGERLLRITAFALSSLSNSRIKERAIRKPFNPLLGETFELVREDKGYRFLAEKISHRPVRVACQAESRHWTFTHAPSPSQKFWGKSAELLTDGRARVVLHASSDCYSWTPATCFLRNIIAGEKYVEPVQSMTVVEETSGRKAVATFKSGGMFSGRSEDVTVQVFGADGEPLPLMLEGKWTSHLTIRSTTAVVGSGKQIWTAGPLVPNPATRYGMTSFAATLNEITSMEANASGGNGKALPPTDSRLRPDQRAYEDGEVDAAERMKQALEEAQRTRRKHLEGSGEVWTPRWFERVGGEAEEVWVMKGSTGAGVNGQARATSPAPAVGDGTKKGYWDVRDAVVKGKGMWEVGKEIFELA